MASAWMNLYLKTGRRGFVTSTAYINGIETKLEDFKKHELKQQAVREMAGKHERENAEFAGEDEKAGRTAV